MWSRYQSNFCIEWNVDLTFTKDKWGYFYEKKAADNINILLKKINDQSLKDGIQYISIFDELNADGNGSHFSKALDKVERPIVLMGVNPASSRSPTELDFQEPDNPSTSSFRLKTKHRNSFQIPVLLIHWLPNKLGREGTHYHQV